MTHDILHGDATKLLVTLPDGCADLILTDPPYLVRYRDRSGRTIANDDNPDAVLPAFREMARCLRDDRYCVLFCGWAVIDRFSQAWSAAGFRSVGQIVWRKRYASSRSHTECRQESAWLLAKGKPQKPAKGFADMREWTYSGNRAHPTEKAVDILTPLVRAYSRPGALVLDPFCGSGSSCVAAALEGRNSIGIELEASYCRIARRRLVGACRYRQGRAV